MLSGMENKVIRDTACVGPLGRSGASPSRRSGAPVPAPSSLAETVDASAADLHGAQASTHGAEPPARPPNPFQAIVCANERTGTDDAARHQAALLASPGGTVHLAPTSHLTWHGQRAFDDTCAGYDLLALGAGDMAFTALAYVPIPTLIARLCPLEMQVTDRIVVCVDNSSQSRRAVELAGLLAAIHDGTVTILAVPPSVPALDRAIAASFGVLLRATGSIPRVYGELLPPERTIPSAAAAL